MDDFKFNAAKMIAAQKHRNSGARSPESDSNWDSSEPENTLPNISSDEEVSVVSSRSKGKEKNRTPRAPKQQGHQPVSSRHLTVNGERISNKSSPVSTVRSGKVSKAGVNVFVDRGNIDSSDEDISVASKKSVPRKPERPPFDFRNALDESLRQEDSMPEQPGKSRKGNVYDPPTDQLRHSINSDQKKLLVDTPEEKSKKKNWKVNLGFQAADDVRKADTVTNDNNNLIQSQKDLMMTMTTTSSDIELKKMEERLSRMSAKDEMECEDTGRRYNEAEESHLLIEENTQRYIYHYNHGNTKYYDTRSGREDIYMTGIADKSEKLVRRCAREFFSTLRIIVDFFLIFLLEFLRFLAYNVLGLLLVGLLTTFGDYLFKPVLAALFNSVLQPLAVFLYNLGVALRTIFKPLIDILGGLFTQVAMLLRAFRLVEINWRAMPIRNSHRGVEEV